MKFLVALAIIAALCIFEVAASYGVFFIPNAPITTVR
jgi:hypothetical protein